MPLALVEVTISEGLAKRIVDLSDPATLARLEIGPDRLAHHNRLVTQAIARDLHQRTERLAGFRWWSAITGAWHTMVLFTDREGDGDLSFSRPEIVSPEMPELLQVLERLGIRPGR